MIYRLFFFTFLMCSCQNKQENVDYCALNDIIYNNALKDSPTSSKPFIINVISVVEDPVIKSFLSQKSKTTTHFNFTEYYTSKQICNPDMPCSTISIDQFYDQKILQQLFPKEGLSGADSKFIRFYKPIFSNDKKEFILIYSIISSDFRSTYRVILVAVSENEYKFKDILLSST